MRAVAEMAGNRAESGLGSVAAASPSDITLISSQGRTADLVWTKSEWETLAGFLHNENSANQFVMAWRKGGQSHYCKSRTMTVGRAIPWAWRTITDEVAPDKRTTFVPYSQNTQALSRWGCLDFDAHDGNFARAQSLAFAAWQFLLNSELTIIMEATGGGWHVWCIAKDFRSVRDWTFFLRDVAKVIDAPVRSGICEVFPDDSGAPHGKAVRAPGSWNPKTDSPNLILWENSQTLISSLRSPIGKLKKASEVQFTNTKSNDLSPYLEWERSWKRCFAITEEHTRHKKLLDMVGAVFHKISRKQAIVLASVQYTNSAIGMRETKTEHVREFSQMWDDLAQKWEGELCRTEKKSFALLGTECEKDAFRIIRNFEWIRRSRRGADFPIALYNFSERLGITAPGAAKLLGRFSEKGIIRRTAYAGTRSAARYAWLSSEPDRNAHLSPGCED